MGGNLDVFEFQDYKKYVGEIIKTLPKKGYGTYRKIAHHLNINSVMVSQIFKGDRHLTSEQAHQVSEFLGLSELATDYFILLVQIQRAGTFVYKKRLEKKRVEILEKSRELKIRLPQDKELTEATKATFYSRWYYSGIRLASSIEGTNTIEQIASRLNLTIAQVNSVVHFLVEHGLCVQDGSRISMGPKRTHLGADSPLIGRHHLNWRTKAISKIDDMGKNDLFFTAPVALSNEACETVRKELVRLVEKVSETVVNSESETLACLNIDWFRI